MGLIRNPFLKNRQRSSITDRLKAQMINLSEKSQNDDQGNGIHIFLNIISVISDTKIK